MILFFSILIAFYIAVTLIPVLRRFALKWRMTDLPDERKVHKNPTPRVGGIGIVTGALIPILALADYCSESIAFLSGVAVLFIAGVWDDIYGLNYRMKFLGQILAVAAVMTVGRVFIVNLGFWGGAEVILPVWIALPLTFFFILGITNAINLADGLDGLAGGISILIFFSIGLLAFLDNNTFALICCLSICGALLAFLRYNTYPASIFMGDTGSQFLGFSAAVLSLYLTQHQSTAIAKTLPIIILGFPILDTLTVMAERITQGVPLFKADQRHFHHRLLKLGFTHKDAVLSIYVMQSLMVFLSIQLCYHAGLWIIVTYLSLASIILGFFYVTHRTGWHLQHGMGTDLSLDRLAEKQLDKRLKALSLGTLRILLPLGLIWFAMTSSLTLQQGHTVIFMMSALTLAAFWLYRPAFAILFRLTAYALVLCLLFTSQKAAGFHVPVSPQIVHHLYWGGLAAFALIFLLVTRFESFEITPFDYLVLLLVISIPFLPVGHVNTLHLGTVAGGMVVFLWASEILLTHQKQWRSAFPVSCLAAVVILFIRHMAMGW
ncbi:MAG: MraY family glycosyltransferase [Thermodesulfobacteriota bacterium]|nr:MraY family glycosyltransferase [Thermodesulfobacteriota bacterium]